MKKRIWINLFFFVLFSLTVLYHAGAAFAAAPADNLNIARLLFVNDVAGLSQFTPKQGTRFAIGDICRIYLEATGFAMNPTNPDTEDEFELDLAVDLTIIMPQGERTVASAPDFHTLQTTFRSRQSTTFLALNFMFDENWAPGEYIIELTLRDNLSGQSVTQEMIYQLEEPTEDDRARQAGGRS